MMEVYTKLEDIWLMYDDKEKKRFSFHDISSAINKLPDDNSEAESCRYEAMAFDFSENNEELRGTYYGPQWTFTRKDTGEEVLVPDTRSVTKEMVEYWEHRSSLVQNPLLKNRYSGLVLELKKNVTGIEPDYKTIKLAHIEALIDVVDGDYCEYEIMAFDYAERALSLAIRFRCQEFQEKAVKSYYEAHKRHSNDDMKPGIWGRIFNSLVKHRLLFSGYEAMLLKEQQDRYERLKRLALTEGGKTDRYAHVLSEQVDLLADYYHSIGEVENIVPLLETMHDAIRSSIQLRGGMWGQGMLQQLQMKYRKYGLDKRANQLFVELSDLGEATLKELKITEHTIPYDTERINAFLKHALQGTEREVLHFFVVQYIPNMDDEKRRLKEKAERTPLLNLVSTVTIDSSGNTISRVGVGANAEHQKLYFSMYEGMRFEIPFMHLHITKMKEKKIMTTESMMELFKDSMVISEDHKEIIRRGLEAYMAEDYLVCCHLLIPQLEASIRRMFALCGVNIMRSKANPVEGNEYISLDSLLGMEEATQLMGEDMANYLRNVLTDQYGWNIRNQVCHGLLSADSFNYGLADRVIHAFLMLSGFKLVPKE